MMILMIINKKCHTNHADDNECDYDENGNADVLSRSVTSYNAIVT